MTTRENKKRSRRAKTGARALQPIIVGAVVLFMIGTAKLWGQQWKALDPEGGDFLGTVTNPAKSAEIIALVRQPNAAYESADGGLSWTKLSDLPTSDSLRCMCAFGYSRFYAVSYYGFCRSADGGRTWNYSTFPGEGGFATACCADPTNAEKVYVVGYYKENGDLYGERSDPLFFRSDDGGQNWSVTTIPHLFDALSLWCAAVSKTNPNIIYAAGYKQMGTQRTEAVLKSTDGGTNWLDVFNGFWSVGVRCFSSVAVDPTDSRRVYAAAYNHLYRSEDGGASWIGPIITCHGSAIAIDPTAPAKLCAGEENFMYVSSDYGQNWSRSSVGAVRGTIQMIEIAPSVPSKVRVSTSLGLYGSENNGATWTGIYTGFKNATISSFAISPSDPSTLYLGGRIGNTGGAVFASHDSGQSWQEKTVPPLASDVHDLLINPADPDILLALTPGTTMWIGLYRSVDGGDVWTKADYEGRFFEGYGDGHCLAQHLSNPNVVYAGGGGLSMLVRKSTDGGVSWGAPYNLIPDCQTFAYCLDIAVAPSDSTIIYAVGYESPDLPRWDIYNAPRVYRSHDSGDTWQDVSSNLEALMPGHSWTLWDLGARAAAVHPTDSETVYVGTNVGFFYSINGGVSWSATTLTVSVNALAYDLTRHSIYAATNDEGVFVSPDGGVTWRAINQGLGSLKCLCVGFDSQTDCLFVGTKNSGIWRAKVGPGFARAVFEWTQYQ